MHVTQSCSYEMIGLCVNASELVNPVFDELNIEPEKEKYTQLATCYSCKMHMSGLPDMC